MPSWDRSTQGSAATLHSQDGGFGLQNCMRPPLLGDAEHLEAESNADQSSGPAVSLQTASVASSFGWLRPVHLHAVPW